MLSHVGGHMDNAQLSFPRRDEVFGARQDVQDVYASYIASQWQQYESRPEVRIAACIMEPVLQVTACLQLQVPYCLTVMLGRGVAEG